MADAKIQVKLGAIEFSGEGEEKWVTAQLDKILAQASELLKLAPNRGEGGDGAGTGDKGAELGANVPLGTFLSNKEVGRNQKKRFLATAIWLYGRGTKKPSTSDVTKALSDNRQPALTNPSDCLNKNVTAGFCEKEGRSFFVTPDGFASMK